jgi:hypothetical protein
VSFSNLDMPALRRATVRWQKRKARRQAWMRFRARMLRPFHRVHTAVHDRLWRRAERCEAAIRAAEAAEIAAAQAHIERLAQAALIGSPIAYAQLQDVEADRVGQARRDAAASALSRLREHQK